MRLDRLLSNTMGVKVAQAKDKICNGTVKVAGRVITHPGWQVIIGIEPVEVEGKLIPEPFHRILIMNKPRNCLCERMRGGESWCKSRGLTVEDAKAIHRKKMEKHGREVLEERPGRAKWEDVTTVYDTVPDEYQHPTLGGFGRLDKNTTGLYLLGTDGGLQVMMTHPESKCPKTYIVTLKDSPSHTLAPDAFEQFERGMVLPDGKKCKPAKLEVLEQGPPMKLRVTIHEGFYHQVKKMIGAVGGYLQHLHRESVGNLMLDPNLKEGDVRPLTDEELAIIRDMFPDEARMVPATKTTRKGRSQPQQQDQYQQPQASSDPPASVEEGETTIAAAAGVQGEPAVTVDGAAVAEANTKHSAVVELQDLHREASATATQSSLAVVVDTDQPAPKRCKDCDKTAEESEEDEERREGRRRQGERGMTWITSYP